MYLANTRKLRNGILFPRIQIGKKLGFRNLEEVYDKYLFTGMICLVDGLKLPAISIRQDSAKSAKLRILSFGRVVVGQVL